MRFLGRSLLGLFLLSVTLAVLALAGHLVNSAVQARLAGPETPRMARERVFAANVLTVTAQDIVPRMASHGEIRARRSLELRAPRGGRVIWLAPGFEDGAEVAEGQLLVRLDPSDAIATRDLALNDLARAEAELRDAGRALTLAGDELAAAVAQADLRAQALARQQSLSGRGVGSEAAVETAALAASAADQAVLSRRAAEAQAEARQDQARTALARQQITLAEAERALSETGITAGFAGRLAAVAVTEGGLVGQNERLAQIIDPAALEVSFRLSAAQFSRLLDPSGDLAPTPVTVALDLGAAQITATGRLSRVGAEVGAGQTGRLIHAALDPAPGLRPGDFVQVDLAEPALPQVALLPASALGAGDTVLVLGPDDRLTQGTVEVLRRQGDRVIVRAPHLEGREVVAERTALLGQGIRIRPVRPSAESAAAADAGTAPPPATVTLTPEHRARLIALVEANGRMPPEARARIVAQLSQDDVPAQLVARLESRAGG